MTGVIMHVVGARPNFMKVAPVVRALGSVAGFSQVIVHTGQHYDANMSEVFFRQLDIPEPDINLEAGSGSHAQQTAQIMSRFEPVVLEQKPGLVLVYGDVNSTVAAALVCSKLMVPVGHVEAGLRSFDRTMPEEINRLLTDQVADLLFTPSADGDENLAREGVAPGKVHLVGNVMIDTLVHLLPKADTTILDELSARLAQQTLLHPRGAAKKEDLSSEQTLMGPQAATRHENKAPFSRQTLMPRRGATRHENLFSEQTINKGDHSPGGSCMGGYVLVTLHRPSNVDDPGMLAGIIEVLNDISRLLPVIFPIHPRTRKQLGRAGITGLSPSLLLIDPVGYLQFLALQRHAAIVITDSGGIQEETTFLGIPCLTVRENTERPVTITLGTNILVGRDMDLLRSEAERIISGEVKKGGIPPLWDGKAGERIAGVIQTWTANRT